MNKNKLIVPGSKQAIENLKYEIARELGISPDLTPLVALISAVIG